jgi:signal peptidase II
VVGGRVVDFIDLHWWPVFNLADSAIVVGALILGFSSWRIRQPAGDHETPGGPPDLDAKGPHA